MTRPSDLTAIVSSDLQTFDSVGLMLEDKEIV